jgi:hypothetical protein
MFGNKVSQLGLVSSSHFVNLFSILEELKRGHGLNTTLCGSLVRLVTSSTSINLGKFQFGMLIR